MSAAQSFSIAEAPAKVIESLLDHALAAFGESCSEADGYRAFHVELEGGTTIRVWTTEIVRDFLGSGGWVYRVAVAPWTKGRPLCTQVGGINTATDVLNLVAWAVAQDGHKAT